jgi:hypothetical protein
MAFLYLAHVEGLVLLALATVPFGPGWVQLSASLRARSAVGNAPKAAAGRGWRSGRVEKSLRQ